MGVRQVHPVTFMNREEIHRGNRGILPFSRPTSDVQNYGDEEDDDAPIAPSDPDADEPGEGEGGEPQPTEQGDEAADPVTDDPSPSDATEVQAASLTVVRSASEAIDEANIAGAASWDGRPPR